MAVYDHRLTTLRPSSKCQIKRYGNCVITFEQKPQKAEKKKKKKEKGEIPGVNMPDEHNNSLD